MIFRVPRLFFLVEGRAGWGGGGERRREIFKKLGRDEGEEDREINCAEAFFWVLKGGGGNGKDGGKKPL